MIGHTAGCFGIGHFGCRACLRSAGRSLPQSLAPISGAAAPKVRFRSQFSGDQFPVTGFAVHLYDLLDVLDLVHELHLCHPPDVLELPDRPDHRQQKQKQQEQKQQHSLQQQRGARAKRGPPLMFPSPLLFLLFLFLLCVIRSIRAIR